MLDCCESLETVKSKGISFGKLVSLAHCAGAKVEAFRTNHSNIDEFRKYVMRCSSSDDCHVISSYDRSVLKQVKTTIYISFGCISNQLILSLLLMRLEFTCLTCCKLLWRIEHQIQISSWSYNFEDIFIADWYRSLFTCWWLSCWKGHGSNFGCCTF